VERLTQTNHLRVSPLVSLTFTVKGEDVAYRELRVYYGEPVRSENGGGKVIITNARAVASLMRPLLEPETCEVGYAVCLTAKMDLIGYHEISRGSIDSTPMYPREVFKAAVLVNAASVILVHNHPSGDPTPSTVDCELARRTKQAGEILGIEVLDHIIIGHEGRYASLKEQGLV
jgi:DNA repair protein RadC